jgi:glycosyltransferase 2 family protein
MTRSFQGSAMTWGGRVLMILGLIFVVSRLWSYRHSLGGELLKPLLLLTTLSFAVIYATSSLLLAFGWWLIIHSRGQYERPIRWEMAWPIYGKTQIAKYVPGNILHFAGRHALSAKEGVPHSLLVAAATLEILMLLLAAGVISLLAVENLLGAIHYVGIRAPLVLAGVGFVASLVAAVYLSRRFVLRKMLTGMRWRLLFGAQVSYLLFFLISSGLFFALVTLETGSESINHWQLITGTYAFAWGIGFIVPGAPAGLGVREAMLVGILSKVLPVNSVLVSALLFRLVTTLGDSLFFLEAILFCRRPLSKVV